VNALSYQANNPRIAVTGLFSIGGDSAITDLQYTGPNPSVYDDLSWIKGSHQFGFGAQFIHAHHDVASGINLYSYGPISQDAPFGNLINLTGINLSNPWATQPGGNPFPVATDKYTAFTTSAGAYTEEPLNLKTMYNQQWNFGIQRQLGSDWLVTVNYLGTQTTALRLPICRARTS
jgi:hypothetical protein